MAGAAIFPSENELMYGLNITQNFTADDDISPECRDEYNTVAGDVGRLGDHLPFRQEASTRKVASFLDVGAIGGAAQRHARQITSFRCFGQQIGNLPLGVPNHAFLEERLLECRRESVAGSYPLQRVVGLLQAQVGRFA